ncbi:DUF6777 domain-containing protein [Streptomyces sp. NPDC000345]|uniref:DUF6777 domain-containing protein n=1 Tax=Streptomyces sp. NPDC000345 TaxID=3364537 RepID=UPI00367F5EFF
MSAEPPSPGRPTGPPSGPLSGPSHPPPSGPPAPPPGGGSSGGSSGGSFPDGAPGPEPEPDPGRPWWRSTPRLALLGTALVAAVALAVLLTLPDSGGSGGGSKIFTLAAAKSGPDPFTESTATDSTTATASAAPAQGSAEPTGNALKGVNGGAAGVYGGTRNVTSCDVEKQIGALRAEPAKNQAFASVAGVQPADVPAYLRSLTPVQLRMDTWVTNHGYRDGAVTTYQAVLQAGTAVLVDAHGVPRVRCACGNPLTKPVPQRTEPERTGDTWPSYDPSDVVVITPAAKVVKQFVLYDPDHGHHWFARHRGDTHGTLDRPAPPPKEPLQFVIIIPPPATSTSPSSPSPSTSPSPCDPKRTSCPPTSPSSSSESPSSKAPSSESPGSESPTSPSPSPSSESPSSSPPSPPESSASKPPPQPEEPEPPSTSLLSSSSTPPPAPGSPSGSPAL